MRKMTEKVAERVTKVEEAAVRKNKWIRYVGFVAVIGALELLWMLHDRQAFNYFWTLPALFAAVVMATGTLETVEPSSDKRFVIKAAGFIATVSLVIVAALGVCLALMSFDNPMSTLVHAFR
ncbi:hypothetical protein [Paraburkholderia sp. GAS32]|uniref:hypothetical protein n=1 Tax=Paraburkholderia sp. GAS32 TaxID=3035129 RepID=UPI003D244F8C